MAVAPLLLILFSLAHGADWWMRHGMSGPDPDEFVAWMASIRGRWLAVHLAGVAVFPLVGLTVWWMLPPGAAASRVSQALLTLYIVLYTAFDGMVGIGTAVLLEYRVAAPPAEVPGIDGSIVHLLMSSNITYWVGLAASVAWGLGAIAAAIALWSEGGWLVSLPLAAAGGLMAWSHFPPFGAAAGAMLGLAVWQTLARDLRARRPLVHTALD